MKIINIQPFCTLPAEITKQVAKIQRLQRECGVENVAFVFSMEPENAENPLEKAIALADYFKTMRDRLGGIPGLKLGILLQSLFNHGNRRNALDGYEEIITLEGRNNHRFCPLSGKFQQYVRDMSGIICSVKPDFMLVDDDFRMLLAGRGCFCPLHLQRFAKLRQQCYTREELEKIFSQTDASSAELGRAYERMLVDGLLEVAAIIREALDRHCPDIRCGYCTSSEGEFAYAGQIAMVLGGKQEPFVRLNNGAYIEYSPRDYALRIMCTAIQSHYISQDGVKELLAESDTFPHNRYSLSISGLHAHICGSLLCGCTGLKLWIDNFRYPRPEIPRFFGGHLRRYHGFYQALSALLPNVQRQGVLVPFPKNPPGFFNPLIQSKQICAADFWANALALLGIPGKYGTFSKDEITCLSGEEIEFFTDEECRNILGGRVILDSLACQKLMQRGFANEIGLKEIGALPEISFEEITDEAMMTSQVGNYQSFLNVGAIAMQPVAKDPRVLSWLMHGKFKGAPKLLATRQAPGAIFFENASGGKVVCLAFPVTREAWCNSVNFQSPERKWYFLQILKLLGWQDQLICLENECPMVLQVGGYTENGREKLLAAIANVSLDAWEPIRLNAGKRKISRISLLLPTGKWQGLPFIRSQSTVKFYIPTKTLPTAVIALEIA